MLRHGVALWKTVGLEKKIALHDRKFVILVRTSLLYISSLLLSMKWLKVNCNPD